MFSVSAKRPAWTGPNIRHGEAGDIKRARFSKTGSGALLSKNALIGDSGQQ